MADKKIKLTIDKNNFLVYQTINELGKCEDEKFVRFSDCEAAIPVNDNTASKYFYLHLDWEGDYLGFDGIQWQLHKIETISDHTNIPSVLPKYAEYIPPYIRNDNRTGYTLSHFKLKPNVSNLYYYDYDEKYYQFTNFGLEGNWAYVCETPQNVTYTSPIITQDLEQFNSPEDYYSNAYMNINDECKLFLEPFKDTSNRIYNKLNYRTQYGYLNHLFYKDNNKEENPYSAINENTTFITFIPLKVPDDINSRTQQKLMWQLCIFCRGEAASDDWEEVNKSINPHRIKMEWRPLYLKGIGYVEYSDEEYHEFFNRTNEYTSPEENLIPSDNIAPADYSNIKTVEVKVYNVGINNDETNENEKGILYDNRKVKDGEEYTKKFHTKFSNADVYQILCEPYYYVRELHSANTGSFWEAKKTTNSFILMDYEGYCLYCPEILKKYGIAFIKSDWVYRDENGYLYVNVSQAELMYLYKNFWPEPGSTHPSDIVPYTMGDIVKGEIYSTKFLYLNNDRKKLIPENGYNNREEKCSENLIYKYYDDILNDVFNSSTILNLSAGLLVQVLYNRSGRTDLHRISPFLSTFGENVTLFDDTVLHPKINKTVERNQNWYEIVVWERPKKPIISNSYTEINSRYVRYRIERPFEDYDKGPQYKDVAYWVGTSSKVLNTIYGYNYERQKQNHYLNYLNDYLNSVQIIEDNTIITKQAIYIIVYSINYLTNKKIGNVALPETWTSYINTKIGIYEKNGIKIENVTRESNISQDEYLDREVKKGLYMTPSEWYGTQNQVIDDNPEAQEWFWLNTLSNWCRYEIETSDHTSVALKLWDGLGNWVPLYNILTSYALGDNYTLLRKYYYSPNFFKIGPSVPYNYDLGLHVYNPMKLGTYSIEKKDLPRDGQIRYATIVLLKDNKTILYKNKGNMDYANVYFHAEYNTYARYFYPEQEQTQAWIMPVNKDTKRKYVIGSETQPVPCIIKLANGNLSICYDFVAQTNGPDFGHPRNIVNTMEGEADNLYEDPTELNRKCKIIFGDGSDKTIEKDWKRYIITDTTEEIESNIRYISDETLYDSASLNNIRAGKLMTNLTITAPRPNPTTNNIDIEDYVERWNK